MGQAPNAAFVYPDLVLEAALSPHISPYLNLRSPDKTRPIPPPGPSFITQDLSARHIREHAMSVNVLYRTKATATGGREGHAQTEDGTLDVTLTTPKELGGAGKPGNESGKAFRRRLFSLLSERDEIRRFARRPKSAGQYDGDRQCRRRAAFGRRFRPRCRTRHHAAGPAARGSGTIDPQGGPSLSATPDALRGNVPVRLKLV